MEWIQVKDTIDVGWLRTPRKSLAGSELPCEGDPQIRQANRHCAEAAQVLGRIAKFAGSFPRAIVKSGFIYFRHPRRCWTSLCVSKINSFTFPELPPPACRLTMILVTTPDQQRSGELRPRVMNADKRKSSVMVFAQVSGPLMRCLVYRFWSTR